ncbi:MAG: GNAT family N-acetyltransferase [Acidimicrobiales bacterium]
MVDGGVQSAEDAGTQPKYRQVRDTLAEMIRDLPIGSALPTERELCISYSVSRSTVRQALQQLEAEQRIYRRQGKGTFVARAKIEQPLELTSHTEGMRARGIMPSSKLIDVRRVAAGADVAAMLSIAPDDEVLRIERLRLADGEPIAIELLHLDAARFDGISAALHETVSLYQLLYSDYGVELAWAEETIEAVVAGAREVELLGTWPGAPLLLLSRRSLDTSGAPTEYVRSLYRGDRFRFRTHIERPQSDGKAAVVGTSPVTLRPARLEDSTALARVFVDAWRSSYRSVIDDEVLDALDETEIADWLRELVAASHPTTLVAESGGDILGFTRYGDDPEDPRNGHVYALYVAPGAAGRGIGRRLLREAIDAIDAADSRGRRTVTLWVFAANHRARGLYASLGFSPDGAHRVEPRYGADEIRMLRPSPTRHPGERSDLGGRTRTVARRRPSALDR